MNKTKFISLILALFMLASLTACGQSAESSAEVSTPDEAVAVMNDVQKQDATSAVHTESVETEPTEPSYELLQEKVANMTLQEKVGQMFFVALPDENAAETAKQYNLGGYILFGKDVDGKTADELKAVIQGFQSESKYSMLVGADEEGGTVVRVSSNPKLSPSPFLSPKEYSLKGGVDAAVKAENDKADLLLSLGINVNLAPVCDITKNKDSFMYDRSYADNAKDVSEFITKTVEAYNSKKLGCVLKHFPGYGDNADTHTGSATDSRSYAELASNDFLPFEAGIKAGAGAVMVSHNVVTAIDSQYPASLSDKVHTVIRKDLNFKGVIITDDLNMDAVKNIAGEQSPAVLAVKGGNDMLCSTSIDGYQAVIDSVIKGEIPVEQIDQSVVRILKWKQDLGILGF